MVPEGLTGRGRLEETRRTARILETVYHISAAPERWTRKSLADKYEVGQRQIQRDLDIIRHRLRLELKRSRQGYYFTKIPRLPVVSYTLSEALALLLAAQAAREYGVDTAELAAAIGRLESVFPDDFQPLLRYLAASRSEGARRDLEDYLLVLHQALATRRKVRIAYPGGNGDGETLERVIHPYCLLPRNRAWYLVAHCELRSEVRMFKVGRILEVDLLPDRYRMPDDFSVEAVAGPAWGLMWGAAEEPTEIVLEFSREAGRWVAEEEWHSSQVVTVQEDGRYEVRYHLGVTPEFVRWLMWYGCDVRVLAPEWLRDRVTAEHRAAGGGE